MTIAPGFLRVRRVRAGARRLPVGLRDGDQRAAAHAPREVGPGAELLGVLLRGLLLPGTSAGSLVGHLFAAWLVWLVWLLGRRVGR